jgi:RimJ/RimL family protein N-acetyltransferase
MLKTERLYLRKWQKEDFPAFAKLNSCPKVCEFLPKTLTGQLSDNLANKIINHFEKYGFGLFALQRIDTDEFIGFTGLSKPDFDAHFTPAVEIGWRLNSNHWGNGFATEAAKAVVNYAFDDLRLDEIVSFTVPQNLKSRNVMEKIGMSYDKKDDFNHPNLPENHSLSKHVLYRLKKID